MAGEVLGLHVVSEAGYPRVDQTTDDINLYGKMGRDPMLPQLSSRFGEQNEGWFVVERAPRTQAEILAQNMGLAVLDVCVTREGDLYAQEHAHA